MGHGFALHRAPDWPPALHRVCDGLEAASRAVASARTADELAGALASLGRWRAAFGAQFLALDRRLRPQAYAKR